VKHPQRDDQNVGPFILNLLDEIAALFRAKIHDEEGWPDLLENGIETIGLSDMAHLRGRTQESFYSPDEIRVLGI
jgi:hypothetical protein